MVQFLLRRYVKLCTWMTDQPDIKSAFENIALFSKCLSKSPFQSPQVLMRFTALVRSANTTQNYRVVKQHQLKRKPISSDFRVSTERLADHESDGRHCDRSHRCRPATATIHRFNFELVDATWKRNLCLNLFYVHLRNGIVRLERLELPTA